MPVKKTIIPVLALILAITCYPAFAQKPPRSPQEQPNVIIFYLDDSGYGDYSHSGNPTITTPTISKLAREGVNFTQFYTSSPACSASRYSLLTGRVPGRSGLGKWVVDPESQRYIHPREITIAEGLKQQGYKTGLFGKWHLGTPNKANNMALESLPLAHGFDQWIGTNVSHDYDIAKLMQSIPEGYKELATDLPKDIETSEKLTRIYTDNAIEFINKHKTRPFFAYIAFNQPHLGLHASPAFRGQSRRGLLGDVMAEIDHSVASVLSAVEAAGIKNSTLVIFSSDNGPWVKFHHISESKYGDPRLDVGYALPFRDGKGSNWEGGHRVPGIFYWPGVIDAGRVEQSPVSTLDILPTVFALTGTRVPVDRSIDGRDISGYLIRGLDKVVKPFEFAYSLDENQITAVRVGAWKLVTNTFSQTGNTYGYSASLEKPLLFQVENDLSETIDRAEDEPKLTNQLSRFLIDFEARIKSEGSFWDK